MEDGNGITIAPLLANADRSKLRRKTRLRSERQQRRTEKAQSPKF